MENGRNLESNSNEWAYPENEEVELLSKLRNLLKAERNFLCPMDDAYLLLFLRHRKHNVQATFDLLIAKWNYCKRDPEVCAGILPSALAPHYESKVLTTLRHRDAFGSQVILCRIKNWDSSKASIVNLFSVFLSLDFFVLMRQKTQKNGIVYLIDLQDFGLSLSLLRQIVSLIPRLIVGPDKYLPGKMSGMNFVNHPASIGTLWDIVKRFLRPKLRERIHLHGSDFTSLHYFLPPEILPESYGGLLKEGEFEEPNFLESLEQFEDYFKDVFDTQKYGYGNEKSGQEDG